MEEFKPNKPATSQESGVTGKKAKKKDVTGSSKVNNPEAAAAEDVKSTGKAFILKVSLMIFAVVALIYGLAYLFIPSGMVKLSGGDPVDSSWLRWSGAVLIALGIGAILVFRKPEKQAVFVVTIALGSLLTGLALLYSWIVPGEAVSNWFIAVPTILILAISGLLWWSRYQSKELLN